MPASCASVVISPPADGICPRSSRSMAARMLSSVWRRWIGLIVTGAPWWRPGLWRHDLAGTVVLGGQALLLAGGNAGGAEENLGRRGAAGPGLAGLGGER